MFQLLNKKQKGFTLIELLVVIAIIGLLASIVLISLQAPQGKARDARRLAEVKQIVSLLDQFNVDCVGYPVTGGIVRIGNPGDSTGIRTALFKGNGTECGADLSGASASLGGFTTTAAAAAYTGVLISSIPVSPTATGVSTTTTPAVTGCNDANNVAGMSPTQINVSNAYAYNPMNGDDATQNTAVTGKAAAARVYFCVEQSVGSVGRGIHYVSTINGLR